MTSTRSRVGAVGAILALTLTAGCGSGGDSEAGGTTSTGATVIKADTLLVCTHLPYKPFQYRDGSDIVGFDVELMDLVAQELGVKQEIVDIAFEQIASGAVFTSKKCDAAAAGTTINDERAKAVTFSDPYFEAQQVLMTKVGSGVTDLASLKGKKLAVQTGTTGQEYAQENAEANGYEVVVFDDLATELSGVMAGRADAGINDNGVILDYVKDNPEAAVSAEFDTGEQYGLLFAKDANGEKLAETANKVIEAARADGRYNDIYKKWFGADAPE